MSKTTLCTYCPNVATTRDHIPQECLFVPLLPNDLITVPSCAPCNTGASKDDEYFMARLVLNRRITHPQAVAVRKTAIRALARLKAPGFRADFLGTVEDEEVLTPAGLYLGHVVTYTARTERLSRVLQRVTLGLRYHEMGQRLEPSEKVFVVPQDAIQTNAIRDKWMHDARELRRFGNAGVTCSHTGGDLLQIRTDQRGCSASTKDYLCRHWEKLGGYRDDDGHVKFSMSTIQRQIQRARGLRERR